MPALDNTDSWDVITELPFALSSADDPQSHPVSDLLTGGPRDDLEEAVRVLDTLRPDLSQAVADLDLAHKRYSDLQETQAAVFKDLLAKLNSRVSSDEASVYSSTSLPFPLGQIVELTRPNRTKAGPSLRVSLLASFEVTIDGRETGPWRSRRARQLFAYLALNRHEDLSRYRLMGVFWPEHSEERAENNLSLTVLALRRLLDAGRDGGSFVTYSAGCYSLAFDDIWLDTEAMIDFVRSASDLEVAGRHQEAANALDQALMLYAGDLLPADLYEEWTQFHREQLQNIFANALTRRAELARAAFDHELSIQLNRRLLELDPSLEEAHRRLMLDYLAIGQRSRAFAQMEACRRALKRQLGVQPATETLAVFDQLRDLT
jgi:DNA-binding SARP family transcriptional activator